MAISTKPKRSRGTVIVREDECKGCELCVHVCPTHDLQITHTRLNRLGYHPVEFQDQGCTACGVCFYTCPEPGALRVVRHPHGAAAISADARGEAR